jgi:hypothetical protein
MITVQLSGKPDFWGRVYCRVFEGKKFVHSGKYRTADAAIRGYNWKKHLSK